MSKAPFEGFLAKLFCDFIAGSTSLDTKYQFTSSNPEQSIQLYNGFKSLKFKSININDALLNYVEAANNTKIIVMLHHLGTQDNESNHEDFIASIRDALNDIENAILFVINNSSLETLTSTFTNVNKNGSVFTPSYVNKALSALCSGHADESIFQYLITKAEEKIVEENLSIFGYESLYNSMLQDRIDLIEHGLFAEPKLSDINDDKLLKRELDRNFRLSKTIEARVNDFFDEPNELLRQLEDVGLSERYIKENFLGGNRGKYKNKSFSELENEIEKNKVRNLELVDIEINGKKAELWKRHSVTGSSSKNISLVSELSASPTIEIKIKFTRGEPLLKSDQVTTYGDLKQNQIIKGASNHEAHSILNIRIPFSGKPLFFQIRLKRPSQRESFEFNFCFVGQNTFFLEKFFEKLEVDVTRNKGKLILENLAGKIELNPEGLNQVNICDVDDTIDFENLRLIDFGKPENDEVMGNFKFSFREHSLPISIAGSKVIESVKLPSIFDSQRGKEIFDDERIPLFKPLSSSPRVVISGREKELSVQARELCLLEYKYLSKDIVYLNEESSKELSLGEIGPIFPNIYTAYKDLFLWLKNNNTILSISNWTLELIGLVDSLLQSIRAELESIPQESLSPNSRKLLEIGMYKNEAGEYFTPFHPISLSYAVEFAKLRLSDETNSFDKIPPTTIDKLNAGGLLPILFDEKSGYVKTQPLAHNRLWLEIVPQKKSGCSYIPTLVHEKIQDFLTCFDMLFKQSKESPLIINSINNQSNMEVFKGILNYYKKAKGKARKIQVNIYDDKYHYTAFDKFSETRSIVELRDLVRTGGTDKEAVLDELIFLLRKNVSLHKKTRADEFDYAHLCFFKNNEEVTLRANNVKQGKSGVVCDGILSGEASYLENDVFYTGFGLKNVEKESTSVELASLYNQLLLPYRDKSAKFVKDSVPVLAVKDTFKEKLKKSYDSSIWTCIIEPKVTLEFFDTKETILIHYADQYTNSVAYDAITVSSRVGLYKDLLRSESDELINSFNALNGQWLLSIVKEVGKKKTKNTEKQIREKQGIVAAYKFISSILLPSDITWVPLSVGEMLRVTGNLGLEIKDSDFAARLHEKSKGALSDDILFVGINNEQLVLLPLEVKSRKVGTDFTKAVEQAKALSDHMKRILVPQTLKGKIYRSLFIQQILTQIDKFELYEVFPKAYFESLRKDSDSLLQGNYQISDLVNYPEGVVLAVNEGMERSKIDIKHDEEANILKVRLPQAFVKMLHEDPILALSEKFKDKTMFPELEDLTLYKAEFCKFNITENTATTSIASEEEAFEDIMEEVEISPQEKPNSFEAKFEYPDQFIELVEKLISVYGRDIDSSDVLETRENELSNDNQFTSADLLQFYRLKDFLNVGEENSGLLKDKTLQNKEDDNSIKLRNINVSTNYKALVNTILTHFSEDILVEDVLNISIPELQKIKGFGNGKITKFLDLIELLKNNKFSQNIEQESKQINDFDLPLDSLEEYLLDDLEEYFSEENNRQVDVLARRLGIGCESETLEEIGQSYNITRERIRQIEKRSKKDFISSLSISPKVIWAVTKTNLSELRSPLFPRLRKKFSSNKNFYSFLEVCCNLSENQIKQVTSPNLRKTALLIK